MRPRRRDQTLRPTNRDRGIGRRRIAGGFAISLLLHIAVLVALLPHLQRQSEPDLLPPPSTVSMVFEGGRPEGPTTPEPSLEPGSSSAPPAPVGGPPGQAPPGQAEPSQPPPPAPPIQEMPTTQSAPEPSQPPPPTPAPPSQEALSSPPPTPEPERPPPPVAPPVPSTEPGPAEVTVPPPQPASPPPPSPPPPSKPPPPVRETVPPLRHAAPAQRPSDFPAPMDFSLGPSDAKPGAPVPGKPLLSLNLPHRGPEDPSPYSLDTDAEVGPDWRNALSEWVSERSYYPQQAAEMSQEGTAKVLVTTWPDGRVVSVELERRSGSPWLDLALEGLFRGAKLPPMPRSAGEQPVSFHFTMHYIIVR